MLSENKQRFLDAFIKDLNKVSIQFPFYFHHVLSPAGLSFLQCEMEAILMEFGYCLNDVTHTLNHLDSWMAPRRVEKDFANQLNFNDLYTYPEPYGVALVIGAWNYPLQLTVSPLIGAIAAGVCVCYMGKTFTLLSSLLSPSRQHLHCETL